MLAVVVAAAFAGAAEAVGPASGLSLGVAPISLALEPGVNTAILTVSNPGDDAVTVQVRLFGWTTSDGRDAYAPTRDVGFSPAIFALRAGSKQVVRLLSTEPPGDRERAYRLFVDQLPLAGPRGGLQMPVRMILPVFVEPAGSGPFNDTASLRWSARYDPATHQATVTVSNLGRRHQKIVDLSYVSDGHPVFIGRGLSGYALAGQARSWTFPLERPPPVLHLTARNDSLPLQADVPLAP